MSEQCIHEREWGEVLATLKETTITLGKISKEVYGNGEVGLIKSIPRMEEKVNNLAGAVSSHTKVIATFIEFQATHNGEMQGKRDLEERERIKTELSATQRRDKLQRTFLYIMAFIVASGVIISAYFSINNNKKIGNPKDTLTKEIRNQEGISKVTKGGYVKYNDQGESDSVRIHKWGDGK